MTEEERWRAEAMWIAPDFYFHSVEQVAFVEGYLQACRVRSKEKQEEIERLKDACRMALRFGTFHQINEELEAKKFIEGVLKAK